MDRVVGNDVAISLNVEQRKRRVVRLQNADFDTSWWYVTAYSLYFLKKIIKRVRVSTRILCITATSRHQSKKA